MYDININFNEYLVNMSFCFAYLHRVLDKIRGNVSVFQQPRWFLTVFQIFQKP